jgi:hypothetical protein
MAEFYIDNDLYLSKMSDQEQDYCKAMVQIQENYYKRAFLFQLPAHLQNKMDQEKVILGNS